MSVTGLSSVSPISKLAISIVGYALGTENAFIVLYMRNLLKKFFTIPQNNRIRNVVMAIYIAMNSMMNRINGKLYKEFN